MKPLLSLVMIVKNEARSIRSVLEVAKPHIDRYTVLDTGSTDGTQAIIREVMGDMPGTVVEEPFIGCTSLGLPETIDFAATRNRALDIDKNAPSPAAFQIMLSGDEFLREGAKLREHLELHRDSDVDCHLIQTVIDSAKLYQQRIFRTGSPWRYEHEVHELPYNRVRENAPVAAVSDAYIEHVVSDYDARYQNIEDNHIPVFKAKLEKNPNDEHALVYLALSYDTLINTSGLDPEERIDRAKDAIELYSRRLDLPSGNAVERNYIRLRRLDDARVAEVFTAEELFDEAQAICEEDPQRPEAALIRAQIASTIPTLRAQRVYDLACQAADVAIAAITSASTVPVDMACIWKAHRIAAVTAKMLAAKHADFVPRVAEHVRAGLAAGGPPHMFSGLVEEAPAAS